MFRIALLLIVCLAVPTFGDSPTLTPVVISPFELDAQEVVCIDGVCYEVTTQPVVYTAQVMMYDPPPMTMTYTYDPPMRTVVMYSTVMRGPFQRLLDRFRARRAARLGWSIL